MKLESAQEVCGQPAAAHEGYRAILLGLALDQAVLHPPKLDISTETPGEASRKLWEKKVRVAAIGGTREISIKA